MNASFTTTCAMPLPASIGSAAAVSSGSRSTGGVPAQPASIISTDNSNEREASGRETVMEDSKMTERRRLYHHMVSPTLHVPASTHATRLSCVRHVTPLNLCDSLAWITQHMKMHPLTLGLLHAMAATALLTATATARAQEAAPTVAAASAVELDKVVVTGEIVYRDRSDATAPVLSYGLDYFQ